MPSLPVASGVGPAPALPAPDPELVPTVDIAPAEGRPAGAMPVPAPALSVAAFATGLEHPRRLHVLPNGDVLAAETNRQADEGGGTRSSPWRSQSQSGIAGVSAIVSPSGVVSAGTQP